MSETRLTVPGTANSVNARRYLQVDVFGKGSCTGNPLAVVMDADDLTPADMQRVARWMNLSETAFLMAPTTHDADYRVRIFTPVRELPFAGHPTLGACHAWLTTQGTPPGMSRIVQECPAGLIELRRSGGQLAFSAPPRERTGPLEARPVADIVTLLGVKASDIVAHEWVDNGPGWAAVLLPTAEHVLALAPDLSRMHDLELGVIGPYPAGGEAQFEVRAFIAKGMPTPYEDPVTGSLNAALGQWLIGAGLAPLAYVASQGTALGRQGRVHLESDAEGQVWVRGRTVTVIHGTISLEP